MENIKTEHIVYSVLTYNFTRLIFDRIYYKMSYIHVL